MNPGGILLVILLVVVAVALIRVWPVSRLTIRDYERGVLFTRGRFRKVAGPGVYWLWKPFQLMQLLDVRSRVVTVAGQEVLSADNISVKISLALRFKVVAPETAIQSAESFEAVLYQEAQLIVRDLISKLPVEELLERREELAGQLKQRLDAKAQALGLELETVGIKDVMFPGGLKQIFAQVVEARKAAQAALEKARGETATLRHLANAAKLIEGNPALVTLKTLQAASDGKHTLVLGLPQPFIPIPQEVEPGKTLPAHPKPETPEGPAEPE